MSRQDSSADSTARLPPPDSTADATPADPETASDLSPPRDGRSRRHIWMSVGKSASARILVLPISAVLGIVVTRLIIDNYGTASFGQYGLLVGIGALLPFADLGISAAVMNAVAEADDPRHDDRTRRVLITSIRLLIASGSVIVLVSLVITVLGAWPTLLGAGLLQGSGPIAAGICLALIGLTLPVGVGQRVLSGLGKNHQTVLILGLQTPLVLLTLIILIQAGAPAAGYVAVLAYAATMVLAAVALILAGRSIRPALGRALRAVPRLRSERGAPVFATAWPALIQMIALPIALQSDRLVLAHIGQAAELPRYNLASQMYTPIWAVTSAAGVALWPIFARDRSRKERSVSPITMSWVFAGVAALGALTISLLAALLAELATGGKITLPLPLLIAFSLLMVVQAGKYPIGTFLTDPRGLRFQAYMVLAMIPVNLGLSIWLAGPLGATGPVVGSVVGVLLFQALANWLFYRKVHGSRQSAQEATP